MCKVSRSRRDKIRLLVRSVPWYPYFLIRATPAQLECNSRMAAGGNRALAYTKWR
jgi:hypothetical protein